MRPEPSCRLRQYKPRYGCPAQKIGRARCGGACPAKWFRSMEDSTTPLNEKGSAILPHSAHERLEGDADALALHWTLVRKARFRDGMAPDGRPLSAGQLVTGRRKIAAEFGWTESHAYDVLQRLKRRALIQLQGNSRGTVVTVLDWPSYTRLPGKRPTTKQQPKNSRLAEKEQQGNSGATHKKAEGRRQKTSTPKPPPSSADPWFQVGEDLRERGVSAVGNAIAGAQRQGDVERAKQIIAEYDAEPVGKYGSGALHKRLTGDSSEWPPPNPTWQRQQEQKALEQRRAADRAQRERDAEQLARENERFVDLEKQFGPKLDGMKREDRDALLREAAPDSYRLIATKKRLRREAELAHLAELAAQGKEVASV